MGRASHISATTAWEMSSGTASVEAILESEGKQKLANHEPRLNDDEGIFNDDDNISTPMWKSGQSKFKEREGVNRIGPISTTMWKSDHAHNAIGAISTDQGKEKKYTVKELCSSEKRLAFIVDSRPPCKIPWEQSNIRRKLPWVVISKSSTDTSIIHNVGRATERIRFPVQEGVPFKTCATIPGWERFESFTCKPGSIKGVCYRLTVVRQFFRYAVENDREMSFRLFFDVPFVEDFIYKVVRDTLVKAKTKINKLWALRFALGWLDSCVGLNDERITGVGDVRGLRYLSVLVSSKVSHLHQQAKVDVTLAHSKEVLEQRNSFLTRDEFNALGENLVNQLYDLEISLHTANVNRSSKESAFRRCLFTSFFILIPVQRLRVIFDLRWKDIVFYGHGNGGLIQIGIEKTSFAKLGRGETIGRSLFIPELVCGFLQTWYHISEHTAQGDYVFSGNGRYLVASEASRLVSTTTKKLTGKHITAQTLRKLRITHVLDSYAGSDEFPRVMSSVAEESGNSESIIRSMYWLQDSRQRVVESREAVERENEKLFNNL